MSGIAGVVGFGVAEIRSSEEISSEAVVPARIGVARWHRQRHSESNCHVVQVESYDRLENWQRIRTDELTMSDETPADDLRSDEARENFEFFSNEYAQALQAYAAIEKQAGTIVLLGGQDELRGYIDQFLEMSQRTRDLAEERGESNFRDWFAELIRKAHLLRGQLPQVQ
jgi:hypothetical protein